MHPERRQHVRILTIRKFGGALLVLLIALATANLISELRAPHRGEYGRLTLRAEPVTLKQPEVVTEGEVPDETPAGPATELLNESVSVTPAPLPARQPAMLSVKTAGEAAGAPLSNTVPGPAGVSSGTSPSVTTSGCFSVTGSARSVRRPYSPPCGARISEMRFAVARAIRRTSSAAPKFLIVRMRTCWRRSGCIHHCFAKELPIWPRSP